MKLLLYKKIGWTCKQLHHYQMALYYYKKQLQLAWYSMFKRNRKENAHVYELEAYDNIGIQYYYLKNVDKAMYYHNRMMSGKLEKETVEKLDNIEKLLKSREDKNFKNSIKAKTVFDKYIDKDTDFIYPHENFLGLREFDIKFQRLEKKELPLSPKYERMNVKESLLKRALNKLLYDPRRDYKLLKELNNKYRENKRKCKSLNTSVNTQGLLRQQKTLLLSNRKVVVEANK